MQHNHVMSAEMLPPPEMNLGKLDQTQVLARPGAIPGLFATFIAACGVARLQRPNWSLPAQLMLGSAWFAAFEGAYVLHTLGHIRSARQVNAPMDRVLFLWGFQANLYKNQDVTPRQHIGRAAGGPLASTLFTVTALPMYALLSRVPVIGALAEAWLLSNSVVLIGSLIPTPHFDVASILRWSVAGRTGEEALGDEAVQQAGSLTIGILLIATFFLLLRGKWRASLLTLIGAVAAAGDLFGLKGGLPG